MNRAGVLCVSLDFELLYGLSDLPNQTKWKETISGGEKGNPSNARFV